MRTRITLFFLLLVSLFALIPHLNSAHALYCRTDSNCNPNEYCSTSNQCTPVSPTVTPSPTTPISLSPTAASGVCAQRITVARNNQTQQCQTFPTSCLPSGWTADSSCLAVSTDPTPSPISCPLKMYGDADCNDRIDLLDFNLWRDESLFDPSSLNDPDPADFNSDHKVDILDFNIWRDGSLSLTPPPLSPTPTLPPGCFYHFVNFECLQARNYCLETQNGQDCGVCSGGNKVLVCISPTP